MWFVDMKVLKLLCLMLVVVIFVDFCVVVLVVSFGCSMLWLFVKV